jgi:short-subunit dehydrogenase
MNGATGKNVWALVTGASAGIGAEFCRQLAGRGYSLVLVARRQERLERLAEELQRRHAVDCRVLPLDMAQEGAAQTIETTLAESGIEVEFLVNNAGYAVPGTFIEGQWQTHAESLNVMLSSVLELTWRLLPGMQRRRCGFIVNVASVAGFVPSSARHTLYGATKAFLIKFSEALAMENLDTGVAVSALCPGFTYSEFHDVLGTRDIVSQMPSWMWMEADEVVRYGIESVTRSPPRIVAVPGRVNRFIVMLARKLPLRLSQRMTQRQSHRWRKQNSS